VQFVNSCHWHRVFAEVLSPGVTSIALPLHETTGLGNSSIALETCSSHKVRLSPLAIAVRSRRGVVGNSASANAFDENSPWRPRIQKEHSQELLCHGKCVS
jgi:hypothetical protein